MMRGGAEVSAQIRGTLLTPLGAALYLTPLRWVVIFSPLAFVLVLSFGMERMRPATAQILFWIFAAVMISCRKRSLANSSSSSICADVTWNSG